MSDFKIDFVSEASREFLLAEISFKGQRLCQINREDGVDRLEIEFLSDIYLMAEEVKMVFPLSEFQRVLQHAVEDLIESG